MKTEKPQSPAARPGEYSRTAGSGAVDYVGLEETRSLLRTSWDARKARLAANDMVSTDEAAELAHTSRGTVNAWIATGRCIGLSRLQRGFRLPRWQFESRVWQLLVPKLSAALGTTGGWRCSPFWRPRTALWAA